MLPTESKNFLALNISFYFAGGSGDLVCSMIAVLPKEIKSRISYTATDLVLGQRREVVYFKARYAPGVWSTVYHSFQPDTNQAGREAHFRVVQVQNNFVCLESIIEPGRHVGVHNNGTYYSSEECVRTFGEIFNCQLHCWSLGPVSARLHLH